MILIVNKGVNFMNNTYYGEGYVPAYQLSAMPWTTSSQVALGQTNQHTFGSVSRFFEIRNNSPNTAVLAVGFTQNGLLSSKGNYFVVSGTQSVNLDLRVDRLFISGVAGTSNYSLVVGLTSIQTKDFLPVTGSNGFTGVG